MAKSGVTKAPVSFDEKLMESKKIQMSVEAITQERLRDAVTRVLPRILEKLRPYYPPVQPLDDFEREVMKYTDERNAKEHLEHCNNTWELELRLQAGGLSQSLYKGEDSFLRHLAAWYTDDRTGCSPLSYGTLNYHLSDALIDELSLRGAISQITRQRGGRSHT